MLVCKRGASILIFFLLINIWLFSPFNLFGQEKGDNESTEDLVKASNKILEQLLKPVDLTTRDPFSIPQAVDNGAEGGGSYDFFPSEGGQFLPKLRLRGYIDDETGEPMALLDVENHGVFLVRKGDTIGLQNRSEQSVIKVKDITNLTVFVEVGSVGQVVIVR